jgi:hypothetical protein
LFDIISKRKTIAPNHIYTHYFGRSRAIREFEKIRTADNILAPQPFTSITVIAKTAFWILIRILHVGVITRPYRGDHISVWPLLQCFNTHDKYSIIWGKPFIFLLFFFRRVLVLFAQLTTILILVGSRLCYLASHLSTIMVQTNFECIQFENWLARAHTHTIETFCKPFLFYTILYLYFHAFLFFLYLKI